MDSSAIFNENYVEKVEEGKKPKHAVALTLGIISIPASLIFAIIGLILGIVSIVMSIVKRKDYNTIPSLVCGVLGLLVGIANIAVAAMMML